MLKFFGIRGEMGRIDYFKSILFRGLIAIVIVRLVSLVDPSISVNDWFNFPDSDKVMTSWEDYFAEQSDPAEYIDSLKHGFINLLLCAPIDCRRANDIGLNYGWIAPGLLMFLVPGMIFANAIGFAASFLIGLFVLVISLILIFKPGRAHREFVRSKK